jgi:hypothetical protein
VLNANNGAPTNRQINFNSYSWAHMATYHNTNDDIFYTNVCSGAVGGVSCSIIAPAANCP